MARLIVVGAGGHGKVVADAAAESMWSDIVFLDGAWPARTDHADWPVIGADTDLSKLATPDDDIVVAIGDSRLRMEWCESVLRKGFRLSSVIHPSSIVSKRARIGRGTVVLAGAIVNAGAAVGDACIINTGAIVEHDCVLANGVHVCPGARIAGNVTIGSGSWIGIGSTVRQGVTIGSNATVGAGSVVVKNLPDGVTAYGVPARIVDGNQE